MATLERRYTNGEIVQERKYKNHIPHLRWNLQETLPLIVANLSALY